jgi:hypothetical protein
LREELGPRVFENRVLRIFGPKREEDGSWRKLHNDELEQGGRGGRDMWHAWGREEVFAGFWLGNPKVRDH